MPDVRRHRGPHPRDHDLFATARIPQLNTAVAHLSWLLTRDYAEPSSLKLVGDRFQLTQRQRTAVRRCACGDAQRASRQQRQVPPDDAGHVRLAIDGFNLLTTVEAALSGGVILHGRDGCFRDLASMHGSYRKVEETARAVTLIGDTLAAHTVSGADWFLDRPVSNSGRLARLLRESAASAGWDWTVTLVDDPDRVLQASTACIVSADAGILDASVAWTNLARSVVETRVSSAWLIRLDGEPEPPV